MENLRQCLLLTAAEGQSNIMYQIPILFFVFIAHWQNRIISLLVKLLTGVKTQNKTNDQSLFHYEGKTAKGEQC